MEDWKLKAEKFLFDVDSFSNYNLKAKNYLLKLLEIIFYNNDNRLLNKIAFTAKYVNGLIRILQKAESDHQITNLTQLKTELSENIQLFINQVEALVADEDGLKTDINLTLKSSSGLKLLLADFEWVKMYLNNLKSE
jgi:hypothetical protein